MTYLHDKYDELLELEFKPGFTISDIFYFYKKITHREPELKAGYVSNLEGPFYVLRDTPKPLQEEFRSKVFRFMAKALRDCKCYIIASITYKVRLAKLVRKTGLEYDIRLLSLDFLFTRLAWLLENMGYREAIVIHDETSRWSDIKELLDTLKTKGYYYNPRMKNKANYRLIKSIEFRKSHETIFLQYADFLANIIFKARTGRNKEYYSIVAGSPRYIEVRYPEKREKE